MENTYLRSLQSELQALMDEDERILMLGEDILDPYGGTFKVTEGLSTRFPGRVYATPISEASIVGLSIGLALRGLKPIVEVMFGDFISLAFDQIVNTASKMSEMFAGADGLNLVIRTPMGGGRSYGPTHSQCLEKHFLGIPGIRVVAPSHFHSPGRELRRSINAGVPVIFVEHKLLYARPLSDESGTSRVELIEHYQGHELAIVRNHGTSSTTDVVIVAYGGTSIAVEKAMSHLADEEIWCTAFLPSCISIPVAPDVMREVRACGRCVVVEEGAPGFGWAAEVGSGIYDAAYDKLLRPLETISSAEGVVPTSQELERAHLVSDEDIIASVLEVMK